MLPEATTFICRSCGLEKNMISEKRRFMAEKGYNSKPMFCEACINARLDQIWETPGERRMAICSDCGCETKLTSVQCKDTTVYYPACFKKRNSST